MPWPCVLGHCHAGIPIHNQFSMPWLASLPWPWRPFDAVKLSCPLSRKILSIMFPPLCFIQFSSESLANFRRACTCVFLSRGTLRALQDFSPSQQDFSPSQHSVLPIVFLVTTVPAALRSLTLPCSSGLIPHRSHYHWNSTRWDLAWSPRLREIDSYFVFLPFANNRTICCHLTKLLGDGLVAHSSLVKVYNLVPDFLGQLFGFGHGGELGIWLSDWLFLWTSVFYTSNKLRLGALPLREYS